MSPAAVPVPPPSEAPSPCGTTPVSVVARPILIVDDDATSRLLIHESLTVLGLINEHVECTDGDLAMEELERRVRLGPDHHPALMLLDRRMPRVQGLTVLRWVRQSAALADLPVVILTADDGVDGVTEAYALGVSSYLIKPVGFGALAAVITGLELPWLLT